MIGKLAPLAAAGVLLCACGDDGNFALGKWVYVACTENGVTQSGKPGEKPPELEFKKTSVFLRPPDQHGKEIEFMKDVKYEMAADSIRVSSSDGKPKPNEPYWIDVRKDPDGIMISFDGRRHCNLKKK